MFVFTRALLHVDMDAFFASVEQARRPELRGLPVVVGGERGGRGVVSTCSYEARAFGVRTAMPIGQAERLCPQAVFLPVDMGAYVAAHRRLVELFRGITDLVEVVSIDEARLDVTGCRLLFGPPRTIARRLQEQVHDACGLGCSIGIGPNVLLAKLAAELAKPGGIGELDEADVRGRLRDLPVAELHGVGPVTQERLAALGLTTVGMLQDVPFAVLAAAFGRGAHGLRQLAFGRSVATLRRTPAAPKSVGHETTFAEDVNDADTLRRALVALADRAAADARRHGLAPYTVTVKVRFSSFHTVTRRRTFGRPLATAPAVAAAALGLLDELAVGARWVRLLGVVVSSFRHGAFQLTLDDGWREVALAEAVDRVHRRYGSRALRLAGGLGGGAASPDGGASSMACGGTPGIAGDVPGPVGDRGDRVSDGTSARAPAVAGRALDASSDPYAGAPRARLARA
jgi:DNA polymerase-4